MSRGDEEFFMIIEFSASQRAMASLPHLGSHIINGETMPSMIMLGWALRCESGLAALGRRLVIAAAAILAVAAPLPAQQPSPEQSVRDFVAGFVAAWNMADVSALAAMFAPDAAFRTPSGHAESPAGIETFLKRKETELFHGRRLSVDIRKIGLESPHHAEVETDFLLDGYSAMGVGSAPPGSLSFALLKQAGGWRIELAVMQR